MTVANKLISRMSLLARFSVLSSLVTLLIAAGLAWYLQDALTSDALWTVAENTRKQTDNILNHNLTAKDFQSVPEQQRLG